MKPKGILSNIIVKIVLEIISFNCKQTKAVTGVAIITDKVTKKIDKKCRGGGIYGAAAVPVQKK